MQAVFSHNYATAEVTNLCITLAKGTVLMVDICFQDKNKPVAIKCITKKNLAKSQSLLSKEIKILKVRYFVFLNSCDCVCRQLTSISVCSRCGWSKQSVIANVNTCAPLCPGNPG